MSAQQLLLAWAGVAVLGSLLSTRPRWRRISPLLPLCIAAMAAYAAASLPAAAPVPWNATGSALHLTRDGAVLLALGAASSAATQWIGGAQRGGWITTGLIGAAATAAVATSSWMVWGVALFVASICASLQWLTSTPTRFVLMAPRIAGTGGAIAVATALFVAPAQASTAWRQFDAWLLVATYVVLLGVFPLGGWLVATMRSVTVAQRSLWLQLVVPVLLVTALAQRDSVPSDVRAIVVGVWLAAGTLTAVWNGAVAWLEDSNEDRYLRTYIADAGLALAAVAARTPSLGAVVLLMAGHLIVSPVLLGSASRRRVHRFAWLSISGLPPSLPFWGRLLALIALASSGWPWTLVAAAACASLVFAARRALAETGTAEALPVRRAPLAVAVAALLPAVLLGLGLVPNEALRVALGV